MTQTNKQIKVDKPDKRSVSTEEFFRATTMILQRPDTAVMLVVGDLLRLMKDKE